MQGSTGDSGFWDSSLPWLGSCLFDSLLPLPSFLSPPVFPLPPTDMHGAAQTVAEIVKETSAATGEKVSIRRFVKYQLGEGLQKKVNDFAAEVAQQTQAKAPAAPKKEEPKKEEVRKGKGSKRRIACAHACM